MKFIHSPGAAYEIALGITAEEAAEANLAIVEQNFSTNPPAPVYGRYLDAPKGHPLGVTVDAVGDTKVIGGGSVAPVDNANVGGGKGSVINRNDPFVHGGTGDESIHADNSEPPVRDFAAEEKEAAEIIEKSNAAAAKKK